MVPPFSLSQGDLLLGISDGGKVGAGQGNEGTRCPFPCSLECKFSLLAAYPQCRYCLVTQGVGRGSAAFPLSVSGNRLHAQNWMPVASLFLWSICGAFDSRQVQCCVWGRETGSSAPICLALTIEEESPQAECSPGTEGTPRMLILLPP